MWSRPTLLRRQTCTPTPRGGPPGGVPHAPAVSAVVRPAAAAATRPADPSPVAPARIGRRPARGRGQRSLHRRADRRLARRRLPTAGQQQRRPERAGQPDHHPGRRRQERLAGRTDHRQHHRRHAADGQPDQPRRQGGRRLVQRRQDDLDRDREARLRQEVHPRRDRDRSRRQAAPGQPQLQYRPARQPDPALPAGQRHPTARQGHLRRGPADRGLVRRGDHRQGRRREDAQSHHRPARCCRRLVLDGRPRGALAAPGLLAGRDEGPRRGGRVRAEPRQRALRPGGPLGRLHDRPLQDRDRRRPDQAHEGLHRRQAGHHHQRSQRDRRHPGQHGQGRHRDDPGRRDRRLHHQQRRARGDHQVRGLPDVVGLVRHQGPARPELLRHQHQQGDPDLGRRRVRAPGRLEHPAAGQHEHLPRLHQRRAGLHLLVLRPVRGGGCRRRGRHQPAPRQAQRPRRLGRAVGPSG